MIISDVVLLKSFDDKDLTAVVISVSNFIRLLEVQHLLLKTTNSDGLWTFFLL
jgi:hypothetical protein